VWTALLKGKLEEGRPALSAASSPYHSVKASQPCLPGSAHIAITGKESFAPVASGQEAGGGAPPRRGKRRRRLGRTASEPCLHALLLSCRCRCRDEDARAHRIACQPAASPRERACDDEAAYGAYCGAAYGEGRACRRTSSGRRSLTAIVQLMQVRAPPATRSNPSNPVV
jgi:hypothetical protein